ncbi:MAG TPA: restriction endonuclease subunit S [Terriglobales bacterium]|nr:restriction endonuclease subunit S [Terriglobales bacterium]
MNDGLPDNWTSGSLDDAVEIVRGISFPSGDKKFEPDDGLIACLRTTNVQRDVEWTDLWYVPERHMRREEQEVRLGDILISTANSLELVGKVAPVRHVPCRATLGAFISLLRPSGNLAPEFVYYQVAAAEYQSAIRSTASTTTNISNVSTEKLRFLPFRFAPAVEQQRIVAEIEKQFTRLDAAVAALKRVQVNLKRYRAAVLKAACEGRLVPTEAELARKEGHSYETGEQLLARLLKERRAKWEADQRAKMHTAGKPPADDDWKKKYREPKPPELTDHLALTEGWAWANLGQLSWSVKDGPHYSPKYSDTGVPFITGGQVRPSGVDFAAAKYISHELHSELIQRCRPEKGDLLYTKGGTTGIARVNTYDIEFSVWVHVAVLKLVNSVAPFYVQHALNSPLCYSQSRKFTHGVGNQDLGLTRMVWIQFGLPPLSEQQRIVDEVDRRLSEIDDIEKSVKTEIARADRLRQSILKCAFEGKLVPQDPNDEPASALLERIRGERASKAGAAKRIPRMKKPTAAVEVS